MQTDAEAERLDALEQMLVRLLAITARLEEALGVTPPRPVLAVIEGSGRRAKGGRRKRPTLTLVR